MVSLFKKIFKVLIPYLPKLFDYNLNMTVYILLTANNFIIYKYHFTYAAQFIQAIITLINQMAYNWNYLNSTGEFILCFNMDQAPRL